jgi:glycosyltransferase involved in cell wall biosynthesis
MSKLIISEKVLSLIVPVFNNAGSLPLLLKKLTQIEEKLKQKHIHLELIFVDDGSQDNSLELLLKFKEEKKNKASITIIKLTRNFGAVNAAKTGAQSVTGNCFMFLAADLQDNPDLILTMVEKWLSGSKYVICVRSAREDPLSSRLFSFLYYKMLRLFVIKDYPPTGFDLALMDKIFLPHLNKSGKHINVPFFPYWLGYKPDILYYKRISRVYGKSSWTLSKKIKLFIDIIFGFSTAPIRFISAFGFIVSLLSFFYGIMAIISALLGNIQIPGFATIISLLSFFSGLIILTLGIIAEYVWRIFDEVSHNPAAVIDDIF